MNVEDEWDERREQVLELFDTLLDDKEKWVLNAIIFEHKSLRTVAKELGLKSPGWVIVIRRRALAKLKEALDGQAE